MPIIDSIYTDPEALRLLYRNPKGGVSDVDTSPTPVLNPGGPPPPPPPHGGGCPVVGQFSVMLVPGSKRGIMPVAVQLITAGKDFLWNPITASFKKVTAATLLKDQDCVKVTTTDGCESIVTVSDMLIQSFEDETGHSIYDLLQDLDTSHKAVSCFDFKAREVEIDTIVSIGKRDAIAISLEGGGIYTSGTTPTRLTVRHNKREFDPNDFPDDPRDGL